MNNRKRAIRKLRNWLGAATDWYANGDDGGAKQKASKTCLALERRGVFPPEVRAQATALACRLPCEQEKALSRWSAATIAAQLVLLGVVVSIASSTVSRWLASEKLKPWRYHSWQHILEPESFLVRARPVLRLYERAKQLLSEGVWVVCVDEKTSIQARQPEQQTRPAQANHPCLVSPRYQRRGFLHLFAALSVADGYKIGRTFSSKRFADFQTFLLESLVPEATKRGVHTVKLILDNGTTHAPKQLQTWLDQQAKLHTWAFTVEVLWLPTNASWLDQIEIWFSVLQRKLLQPNDFASTQALATAIADFIEADNRSPMPINWSYTVEKLEHKLGIN